MASPGKFKLYDKAKQYLADGTFDLDATSNWKMALFTSASNANTLTELTRYLLIAALNGFSLGKLCNIGYVTSKSALGVFV